MMFEDQFAEEELPVQKQSSAHIFVGCLLMFGIPAGACIYAGDLVTGIALATVGLSCYLGYLTGVIRALVTVGSLFAAFYFAPQWISSVEPYLNEWFALSGLLNRIASLALVGFGIIVACLLISKFVGRLFFSKSGSGSGLNRWGGLLIFGGEAVVGVALLLGGILIVSPEQEKELALPTTATLQQTLNYQIDVIAEKTRAGAIGRVMEDHNPFNKFPQLNKFKEIQQTVRTISDPAAMKQVITHPQIEALQDVPAVQTAITNLKDDEAIQAIFESGEPLDREKLMVLLNNQEIMNLLDEPAFVEQASQIIGELNLSDEGAPAIEVGIFEVSPSDSNGSENDKAAN